MAIVERLLPRHWDGRRLLQFLAGLAMLAMSFTLRADVVAGTPTPVPVSASSETATVVDEARADQASTAENDQQALDVSVSVAAPVGTRHVSAEPARMLDGECQHDAAPRAPPLA